jgi:hypothetical protein
LDWANALPPDSVPPSGGAVLNSYKAKLIGDGLATAEADQVIERLRKRANSGPGNESILNLLAHGRADALKREREQADEGRPPDFVALLKKGQIPAKFALGPYGFRGGLCDYAEQIADALEAAHGKGIRKAATTRHIGGNLSAARRARLAVEATEK